MVGDLHIAVMGGGVLQFKLASSQDFTTFSAEAFKQFHTSLQYRNLHRNALILKRHLYFVTAGSSLARLDLGAVRRAVVQKERRLSPAETIVTNCEDFDVSTKYLLALKGNGSVVLYRRSEGKFKEFSTNKVSKSGKMATHMYCPSTVKLLKTMDGCLAATHGNDELSSICS